MDSVDNGSSPNYLKLPPKSRSPLGKAVDVVSNASPGSGSRRTSNVSGEENIHSPMDLSSPQCNDITGPDTQQEACSPKLVYGLSYLSFICSDLCICVLKLEVLFAV